MIISASRRTDIPAFYSEWFFNRIKEKSVCVRNPINRHQISKISLHPDIVDCIVFWSKNPKPMLDTLHLLNGYHFYFQFTLNPYDEDIETNLPTKSEIIETFKRLSDKIGPEKIIWRYDPVLLNQRYTLMYHIDTFHEFANMLKGYTEKVTFSFIDFYKKISERIKLFHIEEISNDEKIIIAKSFSQTAKEHRMLIDTCAEDIDLSKYDIEHARCIDDRLIAKIMRCGFAVDKDKHQRPECGCAASIDIGEYNSCLHGCVYCYANDKQHAAVNNVEKHNPSSALLIGEIQAQDLVNERKVSSNKIFQKELF